MAKSRIRPPQNESVSETAFLVMVLLLAIVLLAEGWRWEGTTRLMRKNDDLCGIILKKSLSAEERKRLPYDCSQLF
jgi:hypothetical protein